MRKFEYKWLVAIAFVAGFFMDLMDVTIVNVALPTLARDFKVPGTTLEWVVNAYVLSLAVWIPASGWIGDRFGTKKTFLFALFTFVAGSILCGLAWNIESLIFFRVLQGIGGGMMTPVGITMLFRAFPPQERAQASSILAIPAAIAPAVGPVLGGFLTDFATWRWIFFVNLPVGIFAFIFSFIYLREYLEGRPGKFDIPGFVVSAVGLILTLYALSIGPVDGWTTLPVIISGILGILLLVWLVFIETRKTSPLLHFKLFRERLFRTTNIIMFFAFSQWVGFLFVLPLFLQDLVRLSAFESGLTTFPTALGWITISFVTTRFYQQWGPKKMIVVGLTFVTLLSAVFAFVDINTNLWIIRLILFLRGLSMGFAVIPVQAAVFTNITVDETGRASSLFNTNRQVASSFGIAILGTVLFQALKLSSKPLIAYQIAFGASVVLGAIALFYAIKLKESDAHASMRRSEP
ncbi:MAG TPA: DHA2 family efflux MFS transporter permease subunit [Patescibacteria group bacterium]|nr:DHA2 family efflux MFS transporter permease subunit [Patescibacteria group bacterium]